MCGDFCNNLTHLLRCPLFARPQVVLLTEFGTLTHVSRENRAVETRQADLQKHLMGLELRWQSTSPRLPTPWRVHGNTKVHTAVEESLSILQGCGKVTSTLRTPTSLALMFYNRRCLGAWFLLFYCLTPNLRRHRLPCRLLRGRLFAASRPCTRARTINHVTPSIIIRTSARGPEALFIVRALSQALGFSPHSLSRSTLCSLYAISSARSLQDAASRIPRRAFF